MKDKDVNSEYSIKIAEEMIRALLTELCGK